MKTKFILFFAILFASFTGMSQYNLVTNNPYLLNNLNGWTVSGNVTATHIATGANTAGAAKLVVNSTGGSIGNALFKSGTMAIPDSLRGKMLFFTFYAKGADTLQVRIRFQFNYAGGGNKVIQSRFLHLNNTYEPFSIPVFATTNCVSFFVWIQYGLTTGTYYFDDFSLVNADVDFQTIRQFDNYSPRTFRRPDSTVVHNLPSGTEDISLSIYPKDTIAKVMSTQFGVNSNFRSSDALVNRSHLYEEFGAFRYPAGSGSNIYFWDGNVPDTFAIPTNGYSGYHWKFLDPDHFLQFRQNAQGEPTVVVNYFYARYGVTPSGTRAARVQQAADYAASWVEYYNVTHNANIKYWEIGNECYGSWEHGYDVNGSIVTGKEYGEDLCVFADAMKAKDSTIRIGAVLSHNRFDWNNQVLREVGNHADYLIFHHYFNVHNPAGVNSAMREIKLDIKEMQASALMNTGKPAGYFPVCMTEFHVQGGETTNMLGGLMVADALGNFVESNVDLSTIWVNEWGINGDFTHGILAKNDPKQANFTARPTYTPYYYYGKCFGDILVKSQLSSNSDNYKVYSSVFSSGELGVVILNFSGDTTTFALNLEDGSRPDSLFWYSVYADNMNVGNRKFYVNGLTSSTQGGGPTDLDDVFAFAAPFADTSLFEAPPYSMNYIVLKRRTLWTGSASQDWSDPNNWSTHEIPTGITNITIPASPAGGNYPENISAGTAVCADMVIENGAHLYLPPSTKLSVGGKLYNASGTNGLLLQADAGGFASLMHNTDNVPATVQSYIAQDQWHMVSAPINNALSGVFNDLYLYQFDESDYTWHYISIVSQDMTEGRGFYAYSQSSTTGNVTVNYEGVLNNGDLTVSGLSYTPSQPLNKRGWNMIGNPFPSSINWNSSWTKNNVDATAYIYDGSNYLTWNGTSGTHPNGDIAPGQGFWVKANASGASVTIPQNERKHSSQAFYKKTAIGNQIFLTVQGNGYSDKMIVRFDKDASADFDSDYDAWKMKGDVSAPQLYSVTGGHELSVNVLAFENDEMTIPVYFEAGRKGIFTITADDLSSFTLSDKIYLEDLKENITLDLKEVSSYSFAADADDDLARFVLHFTNDALNTVENELSDITIYTFENHIYIANPDHRKGKVKVSNMLGDIIWQKNIASSEDFTLEVSGAYYLVEFIGADGIRVKKVFVK